MTTTLHRLQYYTIYVKLYACVLRVYNIPTTSLFGRQASASQRKANEDLHWDLAIKLTHNDFGLEDGRPRGVKVAGSSTFLF